MTSKKPTIEMIKQVLDNGIYYFTKLGDVYGLSNTMVDYEKITGLSFRRQCSFKWEDLGVKFWLTKEEAEEQATAYKNEITKYISLSTLKKITKLDTSKTIWVKDEKRIWENDVEQYAYYSKKDLTFVNPVEYDDDYGGGFTEELYPISEYGKTWALTKEVLENE